MISFVTRVHGMLFKSICRTARPLFVCQNHRRGSCIFLVHLSSFPCLKTGMTSFGSRHLGKEKLSIFSAVHTKKLTTCEGRLVKETCQGKHAVCKKLMKIDEFQLSLIFDRRGEIFKKSLKK